jgi:DNA-binding NarL/FixJ family response regulator
MSRKIQVGIIEDHPLFRAGLEKALGLEDDILVTGYAITGKDALVMVREKRPDVVLLDVNLPDTNGLQVARKLRSGPYNVAVVMLTAYHERDQVLYAMRAGASAYCSKDIAPDDLVDIIRNVNEGYFIIGDQKMSEAQLNEWIRETIESIIGPYIDEPEQHFVPLSPRETEILYAVTHGMSNKEIALELGISQQTVKNHMTSILQKLNVKDRTQAAVTAIRHGWVRLQETKDEN